MWRRKIGVATLETTAEGKMTHPIIQNLKTQMEAELRGNILQFWMKYTVDSENGGFYGAVTNDHKVHNEVVRSLVLCARILWTYSYAYQAYRDEDYLAMAQHAYRYLSGPFLDSEYGGFYWGIDRTGKPVSDRKQTYGQAFAIYGLSEYFRACGDQAALDLAIASFEKIEEHTAGREYGGYIEGCGRDWGRLADMRLSDKEPFNCPKSMNTMLHVLEGYTGLLRSWPDYRLIGAQYGLLEAFRDHIVDPVTHFTRLFFENDWTSLSDHESYGHDIETSWLLVEAAEVLGDMDLIEWAQPNAVQMADAVIDKGIDPDSSVLEEGSPHGIVHASKDWWCQAEGVVGFVNAYQISGQEKYLKIAANIWDFIDKHMIDRKNGEWFKTLTREGKLIEGPWKAGPWEDPYHHSRACFEIMRRAEG
jgi:cellobiose epimerase